MAPTVDVYANLQIIASYDAERSGSGVRGFMRVACNRWFGH